MKKTERKKPASKQVFVVQKLDWNKPVNKQVLEKVNEVIEEKIEGRIELRLELLEQFTAQMNHTLQALYSFKFKDTYKESTYKESTQNDSVNHPSHYNSSQAKCDCGRRIECIDITRYMDFNIGNAIKYLWRFEHKNGLEDLKKALWYLQDEIKKREIYFPENTESAS